MSLNAVLTCSDSSWTSPGLIWSLSLCSRMKLASQCFTQRKAPVIQSRSCWSRPSSPTGSLRDRPHCHDDMEPPPMAFPSLRRSRCQDGRRLVRCGEAGWLIPARRLLPSA